VFQILIILRDIKVTIWEIIIYLGPVLSSKPSDFCRNVLGISLGCLKFVLYVAHFCSSYMIFICFITERLNQRQFENRNT
jgi:hypothetical protein